MPHGFLSAAQVRAAEAQAAPQARPLSCASPLRRFCAALVRG